MSEFNKERLWRHYQYNITNGIQFSLYELGVPVGKRPFMPLASMGDADEKVVVELLNLWHEINRTKGEGMCDERKIVELGVDFIKAAKRGNATLVQEFLDKGVPVNFQDPRIQATAIHFVSTQGFHDVADILLAQDGIDLLIRDIFGRQAWNNAQLFGYADEAFQEKILAATQKQAALEGVDLMAEHQEHMREWITQPWYTDLMWILEHHPR